MRKAFPKQMTPPRNARSKVVTVGSAVRSVRAAQRQGKRVVFTNGCFDLLHQGHVRSLEQARSLGDLLVVAVNNDRSVRTLEKGGGRPFVPARQRAEVVAAMECVDLVVLFAGATPLSLIKRLRPDVLAKGGDWILETIVGAKEVCAWGGSVKRLREIKGVRTTLIAAKIRAAASSRSPNSPSR